MRYARKVDSTQPLIVEALEKAGYTVEIIGEPVDLLVRKQHWPANWWKLLECKPLTGKKAPHARIRGDQEAQNEFCEAHGVPRVATPEQALKAAEWDCAISIGGNRHENPETRS